MIESTDLRKLYAEMDTEYQAVMADSNGIIERYGDRLTQIHGRITSLETKGRQAAGKYLASQVVLLEFLEKKRTVDYDDTITQLSFDLRYEEAKKSFTEYFESLEI
jgi:hypothetical protein